MSDVVTPDIIELRLREAAQTLRRLPPDSRSRPAGWRIYWPEVIHSSAESYGYDGDPGFLSPDGLTYIPPSRNTITRTLPSRPAIDRMDEAIGWLWFVEPSAWPALWFKASFPARGFSKLADRQDVHPKTIRRRWRASLFEMAAAVTEAAQKKILDRVPHVPVWTILSPGLGECAPRTETQG